MKKVELQPNEYVWTCPECNTENYDDYGESPVSCIQCFGKFEPVLIIKKTGD